MVVPVTSANKPYPTRVAVVHNKIAGQVVLDQISTIDKSRILKSLGSLTTPEIQQFKQVIKQTYVD